MAFALCKQDSDFDAPPISDMNVRPLVDLMLVLLIVFIMGGPLMGEGEAPGRSKAWRKRAAAYIRKSFALQESTASATSIARHMAS